MTARVVQFPPRRLRAVWILPLTDSWLVLCGERGWLHGSFSDAVDDAKWLAVNVNLPIRWGAGA
jgi:hypothetical protein